MTLSPLFQYATPMSTHRVSIAKFVHVYPKFTMDKYEKLLLKLDELNGSRHNEIRMKY